MKTLIALLLLATTYAYGEDLTGYGTGRGWKLNFTNQSYGYTKGSDHISMGTRGGWSCSISLVVQAREFPSGNLSSFLRKDREISVESFGSEFGVSPRAQISLRQLQQAYGQAYKDLQDRVGKPGSFWFTQQNLPNGEARVCFKLRPSSDHWGLSTKKLGCINSQRGNFSASEVSNLLSCHDCGIAFGGAYDQRNAFSEQLATASGTRRSFHIHFALNEQVSHLIEGLDCQEQSSSREPRLDYQELQKVLKPFGVKVSQ